MKTQVSKVADRGVTQAFIGVFERWLAVCVSIALMYGLMIVRN